MRAPNCATGPRREGTLSLARGFQPPIDTGWTSHRALHPPRLACFSPQRAFAESADGKSGIATLAALQEKRGREIEERNKAVQAQAQALQQGLALLSEDARSQRTKELDKFRLDTQRFVQDAQAELLGAQRDIEAAFVAKLRPAVEQVARNRGILLVFNLDDDGLAWADASLDITAEVVQQLALAVPR